MSERRSEVGALIADELAACGVKLVASLPDNWLVGVIDAIAGDRRFVHVPVNREESAIGLCSGAYLGAMGSAALMGASGFMTVIYAITKINYTYEIPLFLMLTLRGGVGDHHKHHVSNSIYLRPVLESINMPYRIIERRDELLGLKPVDREVVRHAKEPASRIFDLLALLHGLVKLQECFLGNVFRLQRGRPAKNGDQVMKNGVA